MNLRYFQKGFNYSQDGRGNRLIFHLQGCNMTCPWCANPEGMAIEGTLMTDFDWLESACCPMGAVRTTSAVAQEGGGVGDPRFSGEDAGGRDRFLDRRVCALCQEKPCVMRMRTKGIRLSCQEASVEELQKECIRCMPMFFDGGGVTLTGGEVTMQFAAVKALLQLLGEAKIHRAIETNGSHPHAAELFPLVEEWIMDIKHWDSSKHRTWLGIGNEQIWETAQKAAASHPDVLLRIPLMPGFNDGEEDAAQFANRLASFAARENVRMEVLVYHEFGKGKWAQCGKPYRMTGKIRPGVRERLETALKETGIRVVRT